MDVIARSDSSAETYSALRQIPNLIFKENSSIVKTKKMNCTTKIFASLPYDKLNSFYPMKNTSVNQYLVKKLLHITAVWDVHLNVPFAVLCRFTMHDG
jgi:hypothetical protein